MKQYQITIIGRKIEDDTKIDSIISEKSLPVRLKQAIYDILGVEIDPSLLHIEVKTI